MATSDVFSYLAIYEMLGQAALGSLLLLAVGTAAVLAVREPARRIRIIEWTLAGLLIVPALGLLPDYPRWAVLPTWDTASAEVAGPSAASAILTNASAETPTELLVDMPASEATLPASAPLVDVNPLAKTAAQFELPISMPDEAVPPAIMDAEAAPLKSTWKLPADFRWWIVGAYGVGAAAMLGWSLLGLIAAGRLLRSTRPADGACREMLRQIAGSESDRVGLVVSSRAGQPCAVAWRPTTIVLPESLITEADAQRLRWVLAHEWSHVARGDVWSWSLASLVRGLYFYQPLVWWLRRQLQLCQDFVADAEAARTGKMTGHAVEDYAEFLTVVSSHHAHPSLAAGLGIGGRTSDLERRVVMLVENRRPFESASPRRWNLLILPFVIVLMGGVACLGQKPADEPEKPKESPAAASPADEKPESADTSAKPDAVGPVAEPNLPAPAPPDPALVESEIDKDLTVRHMTAHIAELKEMWENQLKNAVNPKESKAVKATRQAIEQREKELAERKATLRPRLVEILSAKGAAATAKILSEIPSEAQIEQEVDKDPMVVTMNRVLAKFREELALEVGRAKDPDKSELVANLRKSIQKFETDLEEDKARVRPLVVERLRARSTAPIPTTTAKTKGPRVIKSGDVLTIDVVTNAEQMSGGAVSLLLRPNTTVTVDGEGNISLGSAYGELVVGDKTLAQAEQLVFARLQAQLKDSIAVATENDTDLFQKLRRNKPAVNVRVAFGGQGAARAADETLDPRQVTNPTFNVVPGPSVSDFIARIQATPAATGPVIAPPATFDPFSNSPTTQHPQRIKPGDKLNIEALPATAPELTVRPNVVVESDGNVALGASFGRLKVAGKTLDEAGAEILAILSEYLKEPQVQVTFARSDNDAANSKTLDADAVKKLEAEILELKRMIRQSKTTPKPAGKAGAKPDDSSLHLHLRKQPSGQVAIYLDDKPTLESELPGQLKARREQSGTDSTFLTADKEIPYAQVVKVIDYLNSLGFHQIALDSRHVTP